MDQPILKLTLTDLVAIWGGVTGTIGLVVSFLTFQRDKSNIVVSFKKDWNVSSPTYDPNILYTSVDIYNKGRRPVTITKSGYVFLKRQGGAILSDSMIRGVTRLQEAQSVTFLVSQEGLDFSDICYFAAYDAVGNTYKKFVAPLYRRLFYSALDFTRIRKKQLVRRQS